MGGFLLFVVAKFLSKEAAEKFCYNTTIHVLAGNGFGKVRPEGALWDAVLWLNSSDPSVYEAVVAEAKTHKGFQKIEERYEK